MRRYLSDWIFLVILKKSFFAVYVELCCPHLIVFWYIINLTGLINTSRDGRKPLLITESRKNVVDILLFIQYIERIWPWYSLSGLYIRITWFPYMVPISLGFLYMVMLQTFKRKSHCSGCGVAMDAALSQRPLFWRHNVMAIIVLRKTRGPERDTYQRPGNANSRR